MSPSAPAAAQDSSPRYRIGAVAAMTGVSVHALRAWERRYHTVAPERTPGGDRLYSDAEVARLHLIKQLLEYGHAISELAQRSADELAALLARHGARIQAPTQPGFEEIRTAFFEALRTMDFEHAERLLSRAAVSLDPGELIFDVVAPLLQEVGSLWERGELRIAHEHAASAILRNLLGALLRTQPIDPGAPAVVIAAPAHELHEFGALLACMIAVSCGWRVTYLGPNLPAAEIAHVVDVRGARLLLLSLVLRGEESREVELRALDKLVPARVRILVGGHASEEAAVWLPRARRIEDLRALEAFLKDSRV